MRVPPSVTNNKINILAIALSTAGLYICRREGINDFYTAFIITAIFAVTVLSLEVLFLKTHLRPSTGLDYNLRNKNPKRVLIKCIGLYGTFILLGIIFWLSPEYHEEIYLSFWQAIKMAMPMVLILSVPYVAFIDQRMKEPEDGYYAFGLCLLGRWHETSYEMVMQYVLGWMVKGFFIPLMWVGLVYSLELLPKLSFESLTFSQFFLISFFSLYIIDAIVAVAGYTFTLRICDTHIRSTDSTFLGWAVCIVCYFPFFALLHIVNSLKDYHKPWMHWLADYPTLTVFWGIIILVLFVLHVSAEANFSCRFSNLTHRGILTNGLYRFTKHPAYVAKNLAWWFTFIPFFSVNGWREALSYSMFMIAINAIYYLRARTEEQHLSRDPDYVAYALWMNDHSIFRGVAKFIPWLRYAPPHAAF